jgi:hypothetical protein
MSLTQHRIFTVISTTGFCLTHFKICCLCNMWWYWTQGRHIWETWPYLGGLLALHNADVKLRFVSVGTLFNICLHKRLGGNPEFISILFSYQNNLYHFSASWAHFMYVNLLHSGICHGTFAISLWYWIQWQNTKLICIGFIYEVNLYYFVCDVIRKFSTLSNMYFVQLFIIKVIRVPQNIYTLLPCFWM